MPFFKNYSKNTYQHVYFGWCLGVILVAGKNLTVFLTDLSSRSKNLHPIGDPTGAGRPDRFPSLVQPTDRCIRIFTKKHIVVLLARSQGSVAASVFLAHVLDQVCATHGPRATIRPSRPVNVALDDGRIKFFFLNRFI